MKEKLERFYSAFGDRGVMFLLFAFSVVIHAMLALMMELPAINPDEIGTASVAAFYGGKDWSAMMGSIGYYYGYIQAVFYAPLVMVFDSPYALYKAMLVMNGVLISFIPMIAYHLAAKLGVPRVWQKSVIALCCGFYITYIAHSKFIWNEAISSLLPWALAWCVFMAWDRKNKYTKFTFSVLTGFLCAVCYGAHSRLIAVVLALVLTLVLVRVVLREKILNLPAFFVSLAASFVAEHFFRLMIENTVWDGHVTGNTVESGLGRIDALLTGAGFGRFLATLFGHLYTFVTSTAGLGAIAVAFFIVLIVTRLNEWYVNRRKRNEDGTRVYEPIKQKHSLRIIVFGIYAFFTVGGSMLLSVLYKFNSGQFGDIKDLVIFGRYTDNVAPLAIFLAGAYIFLYGYSVKNIIGSAAIYAYICFGFVTTTYPILGDGTYRESPVLGLMPWRFGESCAEDFSELSFIIMSSSVFAVFALFVVFAASTRRFRTQLASVAMCGIFIYTTVYTGTAYLPMRAEENLAKTAPIKEISELVYNDTQSPPIVVYKSVSRTAALLQFLNPDTTVLKINKMNRLPESGIIIIENGNEIPLRPDEYDVMGRTDDHTVLAYGEAARDYIKYRGASVSAP